MKTIYTLRDGGTIAATSPQDFISQLHHGSWFDAHGTDQEYMQRFARRLQELAGTAIRTDTADHFLADLLESGFVSRQE